MATRRRGARDQAAQSGGTTVRPAATDADGRLGEVGLRGGGGIGYDAAVAEAERRVRERLAARQSLAQRGVDAEAAWKSGVVLPAAAQPEKATLEPGAVREVDPKDAGGLQDAIAEAERRALNAMAARKRAGAAVSPKSWRPVVQASIAEAEQRVIARLAVQRAALPDGAAKTGSEVPIAEAAPALVGAAALVTKPDGLMTEQPTDSGTDADAQKKAISQPTKVLAAAPLVESAAAAQPPQEKVSEALVQATVAQVAQPVEGPKSAGAEGDAMPQPVPARETPDSPVQATLEAVPSAADGRLDRAAGKTVVEPRPVAATSMETARAEEAHPRLEAAPKPSPATDLAAVPAPVGTRAPDEAIQTAAPVEGPSVSKAEVARERGLESVAPKATNGHGLEVAIVKSMPESLPAGTAVDGPVALNAPREVTLLATAPDASKDQGATPVPVQTQVLDAPLFAPTNVLLRWRVDGPLRGMRVRLAKDAGFTETVVDLRTWGNQVQFARPKSGTYYLRLASLDGDAEKGPVVEQQIVVPSVPLFEGIWK